MKKALASPLCKILAGAAVIIIGTLYFVLFRLDASSQPIDKTLIPEATGAAYASRPQVILVSYAHGPDVFHKNQNGMTQSAVGKGFDAFINYKRGHLDQAFYEKNKSIMDERIGAGYWLWKPYVILKTLNSTPDGTIVVYADSGVVFEKSITPLLNMMKDKDILLSENGKPVPIRYHLKMEARDILKIAKEDPVLNESNMWAFYLMVRNTPKTRAFIEEWLRLCEMKDVLTNEPFDPKIQDPQMGRHLHDGPLLSLVAARHKDLVTVVRKNILRTDYGVTNFHRHPEDEFKSSLFAAAGVPTWLSWALYNNPLFTFVRGL
ncbi:MAG: hypothetical protein LCH26_08395 [Proteobacteria bacterium]|nr:hypothetical protein [Pseudomonadota bacterium]